MRKLSPTKKKILLLLLGGYALGCSYTPQRQLRVLTVVSRAWKAIDRQKLKADIRELYRSKLVDVKENADGSYVFTLTDKGKLRTFSYSFADMQITKAKWDRKWRFVIFDIPETLKKSRDALREKLRSLGFYELQKSVFIFPYKCGDEIEFIVEFFQLRKYVRYGVFSDIDNDLHLRKIFHLV